MSSPKSAVIISDTEDVGHEAEKVVTNMEKIANDGREVVNNAKEVVNDEQGVVGDMEEVVNDDKDVVGDMEEVVHDDKDVVGDMGEVVNDDKDVVGDMGEVGRKPLLFCGKWSRSEMSDYFTIVSDKVGMPVYAYYPDKEESPMSVLVPPRLESVFSAHRDHGSTLVPFPHAFLCRDWPTPSSVWEMTWWAKYFSFDEVEEAVQKRKQDADYVVFNELDEHPQFGPGMLVATSGRQRICDLAASFERGRPSLRQFNMWMWGSFYANPHGFPSLGCLVNLVRIKQLLWNRYRFFYDVDIIQEVYPDNELGSLVATAYEEDNIAFPVYRDDELSFELRNKFFSQMPRRVRNYDEEIRLQHTRRLWRCSDACFFKDRVPYNSSLNRLIMEGEELPKMLYDEDVAKIADRADVVVARQKPSRAQEIAAGIPLYGWSSVSSVSEENEKSPTKREGDAAAGIDDENEDKEEFLLTF